MNPLLAFCALFAVVEGANQDCRIVGGKHAKPGQFPYIASLQILSGGSKVHSCGATIIGRRVLLTAAQCNDKHVDKLEVLVGTNTRGDGIGKIYKVESFTNHENFNPTDYVHDVAVIILSEDIEFGDLVQPAALPSQSVKKGDRFTIAGWGWTSWPISDNTNYLQWMQSNVLPDKTCRKIKFGMEEMEGKFCTMESKGHGICEGDSGGPVTNDQNEVVGIVCHPLFCAKGKPDFMTDVYYHKDWIESHAKSYM